MAQRAKRLLPVRVSPRSLVRTPATHGPRLRRPPGEPPAVPPLTAAERVKSAVEFGAAAVMLLPGLPLMLLCIALVRLTSRGPAIYTQARVGRGGRVFTLYK